MDRESLIIMRSASEFMSATLNDVLSMQKIEEDKMDLEMRNYLPTNYIHTHVHINLSTIN